jgi:hypothetical protein
MKMVELNPDHPTTRSLHDVWHTVCLMLMKKMKANEVIITQKDFFSVEPNAEVIVVQELDDGLHVKLVPVAEGIRLMEEDKKKKSI